MLIGRHKNCVVSDSKTLRGFRMSYYREEVEKQMKAFYRRLSEKDRRRYAAVEAAKLDHGGLQYIAQLFGIDGKTIRQGRADLGLAEDPAGDRCRKKAVGESESST
jgi:hypothetical protein